MNVFVLSLDPVEAAQMQCDKHIVKMPIETAQLLSTAIRLSGTELTAAGDAILYRATHINHPWNKWARADASNFDWLMLHGFALCDEFEFRYGHPHKARQVIEHVSKMFMTPGMSRIRPVDPDAMPQCMDEKYRLMGRPGQAYRLLYIYGKGHFARWNHARKEPAWWKIMVSFKQVQDAGELHAEMAEQCGYYMMTT